MNRVSEFDKSMKRLAKASERDRDFSDRYFTLGGGTYVRLYHRMLNEPGRIGCWNEIDALQKAEDVLERNRIKYKPPKVGESLPPKPDFEVDITDGSIGDSIKLLKHYGFEIENLEAGIVG